MDEVARLKARDRADLFNAAAQEKKTLRAEVIEKDFWVCWVLRAVFTLPDPPADLLFKGGTSLSKVYNAIERFSEDVDLSFDRKALGFDGDKDPANAPSKKQRGVRLDELKAACQKMIKERLAPQLAQVFSEGLRAAPGKDTWELTDDPADPDGQTLLFRYPAGLARSGEPTPYVRPVVRLEMGARGEQWPAEAAVIRPYAAEALPKVPVWKDPRAEVRVLAAERSFWEKATILHKWFHCPAEKKLPDKQSRHYYDVVKLFEIGIGKKALTDHGLLRKVTEHQQVFFHTTWAKFEEAVPGTLRLVPPESRMKEIEQDYEEMRREMIFGDAPKLSQLVEVLAEIEKQVNGAK
jgi:hypothetical protein